jgi:hypothetical protein
MSKFKQTLFGLAVTACFFFTTPLSAATIVDDDAVFGPGAVLRDTTYNTEFLRLDFTIPYSYNSIQSEFGPGGAFEGWLVASLTQMENLGLSVGVTHGSTNPADVALAEDLRDWFCPPATCVNLSSTHEYVRGLISDPYTGSIPTPAQQAFSIGRHFNVTPEEVDFRVSGYGYLTDTSEEIFLSRPVPLPAAAWLFISGLMGLGVLGKRRKKAE